MENMWIEQKMYQEYQEFNEGFFDGEIRATLGLSCPDEGVDFYSRGSLEGYKFLTLGLVNDLSFDEKKFEIYFDEVFFKNVLEYNQLFNEEVPIFKLLVYK